MPSSHPDPSAQRVVDGLASTARRLRRTALADDLVTGLAAALLVPLSVTLWHLFVGVRPTAAWAILGASLAAYVLYAIVRLWRRPTLAEAAAALDDRASLENELASAEWFIRSGERSDWISEQIDRAGSRLERLELKGLVPFAIPRSMWSLSVALVALIIALNFVPLNWTRGRLMATPRAATGLTADELDRLEHVEELLELAKDLSPEKRERIEELLQQLIGTELSPEEIMAALQEAKELLEEAALEDAAAEAREGEGKTANTEGEEGDKKKVDEGEQASNENAPQEDLDPSEEAARDEALKEIKDVQQSVAQRQQQRENAKQQQAENQQGSPGKRNEEQEASQEAGKPGGEKSDQADENARQTGQQSQDDSKGDSALAPPDAQGEYGDPTKLDVTLKKESLQSGFEEPETLTPKELIDKDTKAGSSKLGFDDVAGRKSYAIPEPLGSHEIPWSYREHVKTYFQAVGPRTKHDRH